MIIGIIFIFFILLFSIPFIPTFVEIMRKEDSDPLYIPMSYIRDPRYFAKSFKQILEQATNGFTLGHGMHDVKLSKEESLEILPSINIDDVTEIDHLLLVKGNLVSSRNVKINKEVYVTHDVSIGPNNLIQALCAEGSINLAQGVRFRRWLDAKDDICIAKNCNLGISVTSAKTIHLGEDCVFRRLFGRPITTGNSIFDFENSIERSCPQNQLFTTQMTFVRKKDRSVPPETIEDRNIVFTKDVQIGRGSIFRGNLKTYGRIALDEDVIVNGNILADGDIIIGRNAIITGNIFSQASIYISEGSLISQPHKIKSIIAKKAVHIENDVTIYGYVATEGKGTTGQER
jgi:predicted acyltransferase (DUF342 family)